MVLLSKNYLHNLNIHTYICYTLNIQFPVYKMYTNFTLFHEIKINKSLVFH